MNIMDIPKCLAHKPIVVVDYQTIDKFSDAKFLSLGRAQWGDGDMSAKVLRRVVTANGEQWSRQSEELQFWRLLDLTVLLVSEITHQKCSLDKKVCDEAGFDELQRFITANMPLYIDSLRELKRLLNNATNL